MLENLKNITTFIFDVDGVLTDGTAIVLTDKNGKYTLETAAGAAFVYISLPAGYAFPQEKKIANFYKRIVIWKYWRCATN